MPGGGSESPLATPSAASGVAMIVTWWPSAARLPASRRTRESWVTSLRTYITMRTVRGPLQAVRDAFRGARWLEVQPVRALPGHCRSNRRRRKLADCGGRERRVRANEPRETTRSRRRLDRFGRRSQHEAWDAKPGSLALDATRVGQDGRRVQLERQ